MSNSERSRRKTEITWLEAIPSEILEIKDETIGSDHFKLVIISLKLPDEEKTVTLLLRDQKFEGLTTGMVARDIGFYDDRPEQPALINLENGIRASIMN